MLNLFTKALFAVFFLLLKISPVCAQLPPIYESVSIAQGLSQGMIFDILQDKEGFLWIATKNGLNRYDGYQFRIYTNDPYNSNSLSGNTIVDLMQDSKGRIWAGTDNAGISVFDKRKGYFFRIQQEPSNPASLSSNAIKSLLELNDGRVIVGTIQDGLNIITLPADLSEKNPGASIVRLALPNKTPLWGMGKDPQGRIWIAGMDGTIYLFNPVLNSFTKSPGLEMYNNGYATADGGILASNELFLASGTEVTPLFDTLTIRPGNLILRNRTAFWDNIHREPFFYDIARWKPGIPPVWNNDLRLDTVRRICYPFIIDRSGILWSGSVGYGLRKYAMTNSRFTTDLPGNSVRLIKPVPGNEIIWVDFSYKWRKLKADHSPADAFEHIPAVTQIDNFILSSSNNYWIKSDNSGYHQYNPATQQVKKYPDINPGQSLGGKQPFMEDRKGNLWFPGQDGLITLYNPNTEKQSLINLSRPAMKQLITALHEDKNGIVWVGTETGFAKVQLQQDKPADSPVQWFYNDISSRNSLSYNHVSSFLDDPANSGTYLWISTKGGGLNKFNKSTGEFLHITTREGLPDDVVYGVLADDAGNIWGSTNKGIFCMSASGSSTNSWNFRNFTKADGLQDNEFNTGAFAKLTDGKMAFGGVNGLNIFSPKEILASGFIPNVAITNILVNNQPVSTADGSPVQVKTSGNTDKITLNYLQDILTLEFAALDFTSPGQNKYRYQLVGIDKDWVESGTRRSATYLHLPSGNYTFKVQGSNSQGTWSDQIATLDITILPPWWRTWWAYLIYLALIALGIGLFFRFSVNKARLKAQLQYQQEEAKRIKELDSIKTQLYTNITHEFRTPLTVILGMARQISAKPDTHLQNGMDMIVRNGESLLNLVNELLDLSKLEGGKMTVQLTNGDLIRFLRYVVESFQSLAASQNKQFHFLSDSDELLVAFDGEKIRQIITNLLSNALKFTPEKGNVYVTLTTDKMNGPGKTELIIKVKDTGIGIPEEQFHSIFDRFYQIDTSTTRKSEGTGIGLALTRELVKLLNGTISVKSPPVGATRGTEFTVTLPFTIAEADIPKQSLSITDPVTESKTSIPSLTSAQVPMIEQNGNPLLLLVEDNADVVAYTASCLPDYKLLVGRDGQEGFDIAVESIPDLIISDVMMPFMDGFELSRKLRQDERTSHIPIIMLTAKADIQSKLEGIEMGAEVYLEKPFNQQELLIRIRKLLETRKQLQQHYMKVAGITSPSNNEPPATTELPAVTENEFVTKVRRVIEAHLDDYQFSVEQLCKSIFMSHSQLHRKLHALVGASPNKFIRMVRLAKAKELLLTTNESIAGIAMSSGFSDPAYFARVFKQELGCTPQEWRARQ